MVIPSRVDVTLMGTKVAVEVGATVGGRAVAATAGSTAADGVGAAAGADEQADKAMIRISNKQAVCLRFDIRVSFSELR